MKIPESQSQQTESCDEMPTISTTPKNDPVNFEVFSSDVGGKLTSSDYLQSQNKVILRSENLNHLNIILFGQIARSIIRTIGPPALGIYLISQNHLYLGLAMIGWGLNISGVIDQSDIDKFLEIYKKTFSIIKDTKED